MKILPSFFLFYCTRLPLGHTVGQEPAGRRSECRTPMVLSARRITGR